MVGSQEGFFVAGRNATAKSLIALAGLCVAGAAHAQHSEHAQHMDHADHAQHAQAAQATAFKQITADYAIPDIKLVRQDGKTVALRDELAAPGPVYVNFIYTTCTTVCPVMSAIFANLQSKLTPRDGNVRMLSISIDPLEDTPTRLAAYARQHKAGTQWMFYTGSVDASVAAQKAFDVYRGDKMNHAVTSFLRRAPGERWVRTEGFAPAATLLQPLRDRG